MEERSIEGAPSFELAKNGPQRIEEGKVSPSKPPKTVDISRLPPFLEPRYNRRRRETIGGCSVVLFLIILYAGFTHGIALEALDSFDYHGTTWWVFFGLIYGQAVFALLCLFMLLVVDPGVVKRSPETCLPIPQQIEADIHEYIRLRDRRQPFFRPGEGYFAAEDGTGDTYCSRCLVWRRHFDGKHYHCNTCQRCVKKYDHHCSVFGRCIAGNMCGWGGNYKYFAMICCCFATGLLTTFVALVWSLSILFGPQWVVPIAAVLLIYVVCSSRILVFGPQALCWPCRAAAECIAEKCSRY
eukprot:scaffold1376_cov125-Cylindrotheca_fusiformis.AAC.12